MRTTVDLPQDVHRIVTSIAKDTNRSVSATVADMVARAVRGDNRIQMDTDPVSGLVQVNLGRVVTSEDVRQLEDDW